MNRTLTHSLIVLGLALFATQGSPLMAQSRPAPPVTSNGLNSSPHAVALKRAKTKAYKFRSVDYPGAIESFVYDYDDGSAVGWASYPGDDVVAFYFHANTYRFLDSLPAASFIHGVNASGQMVGTYYDSADIAHGFLYSGSTLTTIDPPDSSSTSAWGINDAGLIVGFYSDTNGGHNSFLYKKGTFSTIEYPQAAQTVASGINSAGDIVGYYDDPSHGFLLKAGTYSSFDFPMAESTEAYGINDTGEIAGTTSTRVTFSMGLPIQAACSPKWTFQVQPTRNYTGSRTTRTWLDL